MNFFLLDCSEEIVEQNICRAENFLVTVLKKRDVECTTFDEYRVWSYKFRNNIALDELPPISNSIRLHIILAFFIVYTHTHCLNSNASKLDPLSFTYETDEDLLKPQKVKDLFPPVTELVPSCTCQACVRNCICVTSIEPGVVHFVTVRIKKKCKNVYNK